MMSFFKQIGDEVLNRAKAYAGDKVLLLAAASFAANVTAADGEIEDDEIDAAITSMRNHKVLQASYSSSAIEDAVSQALARAKSRGGRLENKRNIEALQARPLEVRQDVFLIGADVADGGEAGLKDAEKVVLRDGAKILNVDYDKLMAA